MTAEAFATLVLNIQENNINEVATQLKSTQGLEDLLEYEEQHTVYRSPIYLAAKVCVVHFTFLCKQAQLGRPEILKLFLDSGGDPNVGYEKNGLYPVHIATKNNHVSCLQTLLEYSDNYSAGLTCSYDSELIFSEADSYSDVDCFSTALHFASRLSSTAALDLLIPLGSDINKLNIKGKTPLWFATAQGLYDNAERLLKAGKIFRPAHDSLGAIPDLPDCNGICPLHLAASNASVRLQRLLLDYGANPNIKDKMGDTPLHHACQIQVQR
jgi:ankyrin repeat protein